MNKATTFEISRPPTIVQPARTMFQRPDYLSYPLDVIITVFNSARYRTRWKHYEDFVSHCNLVGDSVRLWVVEVAFGDREFVVTSPTNERHLQLRTDSELWHKERSQNLLVQRIVQRHPRARWFAFVDPDISFIRHDWADETRHALQHYDVVQMWKEGYDLDKDGHIIQEHRSFASCYKDNIPFSKENNTYYSPGQNRKKNYWHPGYAHAWRREALMEVGGLIDWAILGSGDHHMMHGLIGQMDKTLISDLSGNYKQAMLRWEKSAAKIRKNIGFVPGAIFHHWHGAKVSRQYRSRWKILTELKFDPLTDLRTDIQGLYMLNDNGNEKSILLRDRVRQYFHSRDEDQ